MKFPIRLQLFAAIIILILLFVSISWFLTSNFMERYYLYQNRRKLVDLAAETGTILEESEDDVLFHLEKIDRTRGVHIVVFTDDFTVLYESSPPVMQKHNMRDMKHSDREGRENRKMQSPPKQHNIKRHLAHRISKYINNLEQGEHIIFSDFNPMFRNNVLSLLMLMENDELLLISIPLSGIQNNVNIANRFFLFSGGIVLLVGIILAFFLARLFTRPVIRLNQIASSMALLDFSHRYEGHRNDEIGELGASINSLSEQLSNSISQLEEKNRQLVADIERERQIDEMRREFISSVSHELKTPISLLQGYAEGLKDNISDSQENRDYYLDVIIDEADRMDRLINDLLDLSSIEKGNYHLEMSDFDLTDLVTSVLHKYNPQFEEKKINYQMNCATTSVVHADRLRIEQVLINYINNAMHHVDNRCLIRISVTLSRESVRVSIFNSGPAIPKTELSRIWTSFYKADKARTRNGTGTGLGLAIVKAIIDLHNGECGTDNVDDGVEFWFELPQK